MNQILKHTFESLVSFEEKEWSTIANAFTPVQISAKQTLTHVGKIEDKLYFIIKGILRLYCLDIKQEEKTIFLFSENHFASCYQSFLTRLPSAQALETLEDCTLLSICKRDFDQMHLSVPKMNIVTRMIADQRFINGQNIFMGHITRTPEERYLDFQREHGNLMLRVPQNIIASFLGITPVSLSRIRKRVYRK
jgi:CRP-like cAMP-binding protein